MRGFLSALVLGTECANTVDKLRPSPENRPVADEYSMFVCFFVMQLKQAFFT